MAIYAGTWRAGDGTRFDPNAKVLHSDQYGGVACVRRYKTRPHPSHPRFIAAARYMAHRWYNDLQPADIADWELQGATGAGRRGDLTRNPLTGYVMFNAFDFVQLWADPPSTVTYPAVIPRNFTTAQIDAVDLVNQTVTFTVDADPLMHVYPQTRLATFQIDPRAVLRTNPWQATRLIDLAVAADFNPLPYTTTADLRWPVAAGDHLRIYWRGRAGSWWKYEADDTVLT